jgi:hypothetical protein
MVETGIRMNSKAEPCPAFGCILYTCFEYCRENELQ